MASSLDSCTGSSPFLSLVLPTRRRFRPTFESIAVDNASKLQPMATSATTRLSARSDQQRSIPILVPSLLITRQLIALNICPPGAISACTAYCTSQGLAQPVVGDPLNIGFACRNPTSGWRHVNHFDGFRIRVSFPRQLLGLVALMTSCSAHKHSSRPPDSIRPLSARAKPEDGALTGRAPIQLGQRSSSINMHVTQGERCQLIC